MKTFILSLMAVSLLSGCAHMGKSCCCKKDGGCATGEGHKEHKGHKDHKDCGSECAMKKEKAEGN